MLLESCCCVAVRRRGRGSHGARSSKEMEAASEPRLGSSGRGGEAEEDGAELNWFQCLWRSVPASRVDGKVFCFGQSMDSCLEHLADVYLHSNKKTPLQTEERGDSLVCLLCVWNADFVCVCGRTLSSSAEAVWTGLSSPTLTHPLFRWKVSGRWTSWTAAL